VHELPFCSSLWHAACVAARRCCCGSPPLPGPPARRRRYYGLFLYNQNATEELERLENAFDQVKKQLFGRLHDLARQQIFPTGAPVAAEVVPPPGGKQQQLALPEPSQQKQIGPPVHVIDAEALPR
jgi:hypothetical protein